MRVSMSVAHDFLTPHDACAVIIRTNAHTSSVDKRALVLDGMGSDRPLLISDDNYNDTSAIGSGRSFSSLRSSTALLREIEIAL